MDSTQARMPVNQKDKGKHDGRKLSDENYSTQEQVGEPKSEAKSVPSGNFIQCQVNFH
jgi:hypothetical protein